MYYTLVEKCNILKEAICNAPIATQKSELSKTASSLLDLIKSYLKIEDKTLYILKKER